MLGLGNSICTSIVPSQDAFTNGYSLLFDGAASGAKCVIIPDHSSWEPTDDNEAWSFSFWLKSTRGLGESGTHSANEFIMGCGTGSAPDGFRIKFNSGDNIIKLFFTSTDYDGAADFNNQTFDYDYTSATGASNLRDGNWHNYTVSVVEGEPIRIWNNGNRVTLNTGASVSVPDGALDNWEVDDNNDGTYDLVVGANELKAQGFKGHIDELAFWRGEITNDIATAIYNSGTPIALDSDSGNYTLADELVMWQRFEEGTGTSTADSSSNSNTGTFHSAAPTWSSTVPGS
jgi:hypothetical protein